MAAMDRRRFLAYSAGVVVPIGLGAAGFGPFGLRGPGGPAAAGGMASIGPTLPAADIPKFRDPLTVLRAMPRTPLRRSGGADYYEVAQRQFMQQVLPTGLPATRVWGYGSVNHPGSFHYPGHTFEAQVGRPVRVKWVNDLRSRLSGRYLPHIVPVDQTLHWANPPGGTDGRDGMPMFESTPSPYTGPVPMVVHLHGAEHSAQESDGYPEAWYLPNATDIPSGYARTGTYYDRFRGSSPLGDDWRRGTATFEYANDQAAATLWYHDHTLGMTRANVYAGLLGLYLLRGDEQVTGTLPGPAPRPGDWPHTFYGEVPLVIQDRSFNADGSMFYPATREFLDGYAGPYVPETEVPPSWVPGFLGNTMVVNGRTWPYLDVEQRRYRFRILNASNSRVLILRHDVDLPFWQIGGDGGFLPAAVRLDRLLVAPAERADVIVDFTGLPAGTTVTLLNIGPEIGPFFGGEPGVDFPPSDPATTGQVLQFRVRPRVGSDDSTPPEQLRFAAAPPPAPATHTRRVSLNDVHSDLLPHGHLMGVLGTVGDDGSASPRFWHDDPTEMPRAGSSEVWEVHNLTGEAHPVHLHATQFRVLDRRPLVGGAARPPEAWEVGRKDTVLAYQGEITRLQATFSRPGLFTWHCHILEHEDNDMMRPLHVQ
jgi:FtsP/CotA-like multicopper oxidase with cupredoxin domain